MTYSPFVLDVLSHQQAKRLANLLVNRFRRKKFEEERMSSDLTSDFAPVSSNVEHVWYNHGTQNLVVLFKGNRKYKYSSVPEDVYTSITGAESVGKFLNENVINVYPTEKL